jgi:elongation factor Ts
MAEITAALVKQLRNKTGAGLGACKKALQETDGDVEKAVDVLRAKNVKVSQLDRKAAEGAVLLEVDPGNKTVAIVELRCETDFGARSDNFKTLIKAVAQAVLEHKPATLEEARELKPVADGLQEAAALTIKENIVLARADVRTLEGEGRVGCYVHHNGQIGTVVAVHAPEEVASKPEVADLIKDLAMHATAHHPAPVAVDRESIPEDLVAREKAVALRALDENPKDAKKPDNIKEKIVDGKLRKFFEERALVDQKFVKDPETRIRKLLEAKSKELGGTISVAWFTRVKLGES